MKLDASLPAVPLSQVPAIARAAEQLGFQALWSTETQHDPFLPGALIAEHTQKLRFGTAVAIAFARSPGKPGLPGLGSGAGFPRPLHPGIGHPGQGAHRAPFRHDLARFSSRQCCANKSRR